MTKTNPSKIEITSTDEAFSMAHLGTMTLLYVTKIMVDFETLPTDRIMRAD